MATTFAAINQVFASTTVTPLTAAENMPYIPMTAAQRTTVVTAVNGGTITTLADVLALIATAAVAPPSQKQVYDLIVNPLLATVG